MGATGVFICEGGVFLLPHRFNYQPLPCIRYLGNTWVGVLPEGEEFFVMLYGIGLSILLLVSNRCVINGPVEKEHHSIAKFHCLIQIQYRI